MKILGVIPARYASSRFPGKALADIQGLSMIQRVYLQVAKTDCLTKTIIATDDNRIYDHVNEFGGEVLMTSSTHKNGTERCLEVLNAQQDKFDYVINIQGDEPFIDPRQIELLASLLDGNTELATLAKIINNKQDLFNNNINKVILNTKNEALYFSRTPIPFYRSADPEHWITRHHYYKHIGIYAYRKDILEEINKLSPSPLELAESLEQLRWIENGFIIKVAVTELDSIGIDTPEDLERVLAMIKPE